MNFLIVGDIVGKTGLERLEKELPKLMNERNIDFCIVNGENSANGKGLRKQEYDKIKACGADVITMGNHIYYRKEMANEYIKLERMAIPANITNLNGNKNVIIEKNGIKLGVINLIGRAEMNDNLFNSSVNPFLEVTNQINELKEKNVDYIVVDFHAEATAEKIAMGFYLSDKVNLVFGTHTHVQTADERILDTGMAYITDVGMVGPSDSVLGLKKEIAINRFLTGNYIKYECSENKAIFNAIIVEFDDISKKAVSIKRINN